MSPRRKELPTTVESFSGSLRWHRDPVIGRLYLGNVISRESRNVGWNYVLFACTKIAARFRHIGVQKDHLGERKTKYFCDRPCTTWSKWFSKIGVEPVCVRSEESFVVMDYATLQNVEVEIGEDVEERTSSPVKNSPFLSFKLRMSKNSEGRAEQICLVAESR